MPNTYQLIEAKNLGASTSSITFSAIPGTYTDLKVLFSIRGTDSTPAAYMQFNGSTSGYNFKFAEGSGSGTNSNTSAYGIFTTSIYLNQIDGTGFTSDVFSNGEAYIPNYAGSTYKSASVNNVIENNGTTAYASICAGLWSNTAAITSITITPTSLNFAQYSSFYLYGIKNS